MAFCMNCGQELPDGAKFCSNCGAPVASAKINSAQRKMEYEGIVHKCPNCGEVLDAFVVVCPSCGYELRDMKAADSVQDFFTRIGETTSNSQKINLIRNYPISNTKEDILEFMILASSNINMDLYGKTHLTPDEKVLKNVSDAWLSKFDQAYQKAQFSFSETSTFTQIQKVFDRKTEELNHQQKQKQKHKEDAQAIPILIVSMILLVIMMFIFYLITK